MSYPTKLPAPSSSSVGATIVVCIWYAFLRIPFWAFWLMLGFDVVNSYAPSVPAFGFGASILLFMALLAVKAGLTRMTAQQLDALRPSA